MAPSSAPEKPRHGDGLPFLYSAGCSVQSLTANILSHLPFPPFNPNRTAPAAKPPIISPPGGYFTVTVPLLLPPSSSSDAAGSSSHRSLERGAPSSTVRSFKSGVRIDGFASSSKGGGPAFVGQVFSMLDRSGNGLMAVTTRFDIPFISKRAPVWIKKILATVMNNEQKGPVFQFFMDLSDAVSHVKHLNVPTGMVGACRLDVAYEHFKEKPHMFQFVPNKKQVKAANELLKKIPRKHRRTKVDGVPVFTAQNLNIAIATSDGIKWYTPYFFDKSLLDNILEASIDQHFHTLIQNRRMQRRRDIIDDNVADVVEEYNDSLFEPPEVQQMMDEMGQYGIPRSVISKAAEIQLLDVVDKVLLGNKWLREVTGIQPKFPYMVESFEERSATSFSGSSLSATTTASNLESSDKEQTDLQLDASEVGSDDNLRGHHGQSSSQSDFQFPFGNLFQNPWRRQHQKQQNARSEDDATNEILLNPFLPKVTMVGVSVGDGQTNRANLKKTMEDLTKELEQASHKSKLIEDMDPLFIANVGDYSSITRLSSS